MNKNELIKLRKRFGWSQAEAAKHLGCSARSIANWESGTHKIPRSISLAVTAVVMDMKPYGDEN